MVVQEDPMRRTGLIPVTVAALTIAIAAAGCSKPDNGGTPSAEQGPAQSGAVGTGGAGADLKSNDEFVRDIAVKNMAQLELSRLALEKSPNAGIKAFAMRVLDEHGAAGEKLKSIVSAQQIAWPAELDDKRRSRLEELAQQQGDAFDRDYLEATIESHQDLAAKLESRLDVQSVADWKTAAAGRTRTQALPEPDTALADVKVRPARGGDRTTMSINEWAAETYPVAQKHLDSARMLERAAQKR
jgi:putative membrane protein